MKKILTAFLLIFFATAHSQGNGGVIQEFFHAFGNLSTSSTQGFTGYDQIVQVNTNATSTGSISWGTTNGADASQSFGHGTGGSSLTGYLYGAPGGMTASTDSQKRLVYSATAINVSRTGKEISRFGFATANQGTTINMWFAVKLATSGWFCYGPSAGYNQADVGTSGTNETTAWGVKKVYDIVPSGASWYALTTTPNLVRSGAAQSLPTGEDIIAVGIFAYRTSSSASTLRIDNITLYTTSTTLPVPAPPTSVNLTGSGTAWQVSWTAASGYASASAYEKTQDGGLTWTDCTANPETLTTSDYFQEYQVGIRVKSVAATNTYSQTAWNTKEARAANLVFKETFPFVSSSNLGTNGWRQWYSATATVSTSSSMTSGNGSPDIGPLNSFAPNTYRTGYVISNSATTDRRFFFTNYTTNIPTPLSSIVYDVAATGSGTSEWGSQVVVKVAGRWLVWGNTPVYQSGSYSNFNTPEQKTWTITPGAVNWYELTFTEGSTMAISTTAETLPVGISLSGIGVYFSRTAASSNTVRLDNVKVYTGSSGNTGIPLWFLN